jgi:hypothetical protein
VWALVSLLAYMVILHGRYAGWIGNFGLAAGAVLGAAVIGLMYGRLPPGCRAATSDMKVRIDATDLSTFPDVVVVCGAREVAGTGEAAEATTDNDHVKFLGVKHSFKLQ